jgi:hypothetical protein
VQELQIGGTSLDPHPCRQCIPSCNVPALLTAITSSVTDFAISVIVKSKQQCRRRNA